eukprot:TRINITY_DN4149_c0_g1_i5.p2 TRINITY_DN4149_c0_g1~~TRINITY_DN4149_c0_g1_i5.p2  ORF type:complete len:137 (+),score=46.98 TRINITY_DN4149_c0_g1_i5:46-411(+)
MLRSLVGSEMCIRDRIQESQLVFELLLLDLLEQLVKSLRRFQVLLELGGNQHAAGWPLREGGSPKLLLRVHIDVWNVVLLTEDRQVRNHIHGRNVPGNHADPFLSLADRLDYLLHPPQHLL